MDTLKKILIAEDDEKDIELTLTALKGFNIANEIVITHDGQEVLDYLYYRGEYENRKRGNPAVILLDIKMPKINGLEVLKQIKSDEYLCRIPAVILTSSKEERDLIEGYNLGANAYVVKPMDFSEFVSAVRGLGMFWAVINEPPPEN
ncbi:MAG: response regulator [Ignavibacteriaceae bacterium]|nr:response regulator [Ignavibacteriaceae bacterium]